MCPRGATPLSCVSSHYSYMLPRYSSGSSDREQARVRKTEVK